MEEMKQIAECGICADLFSNPRVLPCIHTFCLECLDKASLNLQLEPEDSMPCPTCKTPFVIPTEGMTGLKKNSFVDKMVGVSKITEMTNRPVLCELCKKDSEWALDDIPRAAQYCIQCQKNICNRCCRDHKKYEALKDHQLFAFGSYLDVDLIRNFAPRYCEYHRKREVEIYCSSCQDTICMMCFAESHKSHDCSDIEKVSAVFRQEILFDLERLALHSEEVSKKIRNISETQMEFLTDAKNMEETIIQRGNDLKILVDKRTDNLLNELNSQKKKYSKQFDREKNEIKRHGTSVESLESYSKQLVSNGSSAEICQSIHYLRSRNEKLHAITRDNVRRQTPSVEIIFEESKLKDILEAENAIGSIKANRPKSVLNRDQVHEKGRLIQLIINGLNGQRFVLNVLENCPIEDLFRTLYYHPNCPKTCGLRLVHGGDQIENNRGKRLQDYGIGNGSTLHLIVRLTGG